MLKRIFEPFSSKAKERSELAESLYKQNLELALKNKTLSLLEKLYTISLKNFELKKLGDECTSLIRSTFDFEIVGVFSLKRGQFVPLSVTLSDFLLGANGVSGILQSAKISQEVVKSVLKEKDMLLSFKVDEIWQFYQENFNPIVNQRVKSVIVVPLLVDEKLTGIFVAGLNRSYANITSFEKEAIANLNNVVALAIDRASIYEKLEMANVKLRDLDQAKTEFLSLASHQLRSPLTAIKGYSSMILEGSFGRITKRIREPLDRVFQSSVSLAQLVNDLLDVSKIEQGGMKYEFKIISLSRIVDNVVNELKITAKDKGLKLKLVGTSAHQYAIRGDSLKMRQVLVNLIDNAIKYTDKGSITVSLNYVTKNKKRKVLISITDTGRGVTAETKEKLFGKFSRGEAGRSNTGGSGLGLYLAQQIVVAHAGRVWLESEGEGKGSTFFIELPTQYL